MLDITKIKVRDILEMKNHLGKTTIQEVFQVIESLGGEMTDEGLGIMVYLAMLDKRQTNPEFTIDDAYDLTFEELTSVLSGGDNPLTEEASKATE